MSNKNRHGNQQQQGQPQSGGEHKDREKRPPRLNFLTYNARVAWRYATLLLQEGFLAAVFVAPIWLVFYLLGVTEVRLPVNFQYLWAIGFFVFILQNSLFRRGG